MEYLINLPTSNIKEEGMLFLIDKPLGWTSFDVVNKLRHSLRNKLGIKKIKVGHAGTLDPLATGLLLICVGPYTKRIDGLNSDRKTYTGTFEFGATTPSFDKEQEVDAQFPYDHLTDDMIRDAASSFLGEQLQTPPVFSAKKIDGKRAYKSAHAGKEVKMRQQLVNIHRFEIAAVSLPDVSFEIEASKGTYIRSIAHDFGLRLKSGAHLKTLRRTKSGDFSIEHAISLEEATSRIAEIPMLESE